MKYKAFTHEDVLFSTSSDWDIDIIDVPYETLNRRQKFSRILQRVSRFELADLHHLIIRKPYIVDY